MEAGRLLPQPAREEYMVKLGGLMFRLDNRPCIGDEILFV